MCANNDILMNDIKVRVSSHTHYFPENSFNNSFHTEEIIHIENVSVP
jgi:hypothetical protein